MYKVHRGSSPDRAHDWTGGAPSRKKVGPDVYTNDFWTFGAPYLGLEILNETCHRQMYVKTSHAPQWRPPGFEWSYPFQIEMFCKLRSVGAPVFGTKYGPYACRFRTCADAEPCCGFCFSSETGCVFSSYEIWSPWIATWTCADTRVAGVKHDSLLAQTVLRHG